jgi:transposase InsO family protein
MRPITDAAACCARAASGHAAAAAPSSVMNSRRWASSIDGTSRDGFSRYILAWKLCTTMSATDVSDTLQVALQGCRFEPGQGSASATAVER